jgi:hypothetical protein
MDSLLDRAKKVRVNSKTRDGVTDEDIELALAWARGEIALKQVAVALGGVAATSAYARLAISLRKVFKDKKW